VLLLNNAGNWTTDELRIGATYQSVTPTAVPEPSMAWPLLLLIPGTACLRRWKILG